MLVQGPADVSVHIDQTFSERADKLIVPRGRARLRRQIWLSAPSRREVPTICRRVQKFCIHAAVLICGGITAASSYRQRRLKREERHTWKGLMVCVATDFVCWDMYVKLTKLLHPMGGIERKVLSSLHSNTRHVQRISLMNARLEVELTV